MRILHVSLGDPFNHEGGLNRYCVDLINAQKNIGDEVFVLYPGRYIGKDGKVKIKKVSEMLYRIDNALPVPITYGIDNPKRYMAHADESIFRVFLNNIRPAVVHVHSFMGVYKEFFCACVHLGIRIVFTTHDYYPFCFKCNLIDYENRICKQQFSAEKCSRCNAGCGLTKRKQMLMQSIIYQSIKNTEIIKKLKKGHVTIENKSKEELSVSIRPNEYQSLHEYYFEIMSMMSVIHCNSDLSKKLYEIAFPELSFRTIPITHSGIRQDRHIRKNDTVLKISYFGGTSPHKGYNQLKELVRFLPNDESWELNLYGGIFPNELSDKRIHTRGYFSQKDEALVWENTDLLIFISQWPESFGFCVLEALALDIPVICSDLAGSSVLVKDIEECVYKYDDVAMLANKIEFFLDIKAYRAIQDRITNLPIDIDIIQHEKRIKELYEEVM